MLIRFRETFSLPVEEVFAYFETPRGWVRLYGLAGEVDDRGDGWVAVPLKAFPFPLVAKSVRIEPNEFVRWVFKGFWRGEGEVHFSVDGERTTLDGYEEISIRWLGPLSSVVEKLFLEKRFEAIWALGWRRLRKRERTRTGET